MKKIIYFFGALIIVLNIFFSLSLENKISIDDANASDRSCAYLLGSYWGYVDVYLSPCIMDGKECGVSTTCDPQTNSLCNGWVCYVEV